MLLASRKECNAYRLLLLLKVRVVRAYSSRHKFFLVSKKNLPLALLLLGDIRRHFMFGDQILVVIVALEEGFSLYEVVSLSRGLRDCEEEHRSYKHILCLCQERTRTLTSLFCTTNVRTSTQYCNM